MTQVTDISKINYRLELIEYSMAQLDFPSDLEEDALGIAYGGKGTFPYSLKSIIRESEFSFVTRIKEFEV